MQLKAIRTGILYYGVSLGIYRLSTAYTMPPPFPANTRHMIYASPAIEANVHLGKRFSFADNALDLGITGGIAVHKADGATTDETSYVGNYKPNIWHKSRIHALFQHNRHRHFGKPAFIKLYT